jgi:putative oxidoreductase
MFKSGSIKLKYLVWAAMAIVSLVVIGGGIAKLMGVEMVLASFATLGLPAISGTFIGLCEIAGGIGIWFRRTSKYAAGGLAIIMLGAIYYHALHTPIMEGLVAFIILLICGYIVKRRGTGIIG